MWVEFHLGKTWIADRECAQSLRVEPEVKYVKLSYYLGHPCSKTMETVKIPRFLVRAVADALLRTAEE